MSFTRVYLLTLAFASLGCSGGSDEQPDKADRDSPRILAAYHGLDELPDAVSLICAADVAGADGMPVVFSVQIDHQSVTPDAFSVETSEGEVVTPLCATLAPAIEPLERRTVLLAGAFGSSDKWPTAVEVVGDLRAADGHPLVGLRTDRVSPLAAGPSLVFAERFEPDTIGLAGECPAGTRQVVQMTWDGGVHGAGHLPLGEPQRLGTTVTLEDGRQVQPIALADDDPDNHVHACLDQVASAQTVSIAADLFEDPGGDLNLETQVVVQE